MELDESSGMTPMARNRTITVLACLPTGGALRSNTPWAQAPELHAKTAARQVAKRVRFIVTPILRKRCGGVNKHLVNNAGFDSDQSGRKRANYPQALPRSMKDCTVPPATSKVVSQLRSITCGGKLAPYQPR